MENILELLKNEKVEWKKLGEVCDIKTGKLNASAKEDDGIYPFFTCDEKPSKINKYAFDTTAILLSGNGSRIGHVNLYSGKFNAYQRTYVIEIIDKEMGIKFLYHYFKANIKKYIDINKIGSSIPYITLPILKKFEIPIPSLETQEKIAKILDKFEKYATELQAELQAELQKRYKQYNYYRDELLSEEYLNKISEKIINLKNYNEINRVKIGDLCLRQKGINITAEKMKELNKENGKVKIFAGGSTTANVDIEVVGEKNIIKVPSVIVKSRGNIDFEYYDNLFSHKNEMWSYSTLDENILNIKYLYYYLKNNLKYFKDNSISGKLPQISIGLTDNYKILLPHIFIQNKVVEILDKFQDYINDTKGLLPKEIEQRRKQYEYYREKLLTFEAKYDRAEQSRAEQRIIINSSFFKVLKEAAELVGVQLTKVVEWKSLGEIGIFINGSGMPKTMFTENGEIGAIHYGHIYTKYNKFVIDPIVKISKENSEKLKKIKYGDLVIAKTSENLEDIMKTIAYLGDKEVVVGGHSAIFRHYENPKYLSYVFNGYKELIKQKNRLSRGVKVIEISTSEMEKIEIPIPPLEVQEYVVEKLDKFDKLVNDIKEGLPREIELVQKQYEYYREKLLDFNREL